MKRIFLLIATNIAVVVMLTIVGSLFGLDQYVASAGGSWGGLLIFAALYGFGGAFISLLISKWSAKRMMGVRVIERPANATERWLLDTVRSQAEKVRIRMPEVGVFESPQPNAFATGANRNKALVAVSTGLLHCMDPKEVEAVLGHEIGHVANGDMVTLTLIQGVVNTFVIFFARIVGSIVDRAVFRNESERGGIGYFITVMVAQIVFGILAGIIVAWFSRQREFRADAAGARLAGTSGMIGALEALQRVHNPHALPEQMAAFGIAGGIPAGFRKLFMSHPPLDVRIAALRRASVS